MPTGLMAGIVFLFVTGNLFSMMLEGTSGVNATTLSSNITASTLYIPIADDTGFDASDSRIFINGEELRYDSIQTSTDSNCAAQPCLVLTSDDRGLNGTNAASHASGSRVYSQTLGLINLANNFGVADLKNFDGPTDILTVPFLIIGAIAKFVVTVIAWDYSFLEGNAIFIKIALLYPISAAFIFAVIAFVRRLI